MAYQPFYTPTDWQNLPSQKTALNRTNLLHAENGIKEADNRIVQLDAKKAEQSTVNTMVKDVSMDTKTGVLTVKLQNGTTKTYDLAIEKVVTNFDINDKNELVLTLADGTKKTIDLVRFVYSVGNTPTVSMSIKNRVITATIVDDSVTMNKLDAAIQREFRQYLLDARAARDSAMQYQKYAKRYAFGDEDYPGSETDNAKYYYEQAKVKAEASGRSAQGAAISADVATEQAVLAAQKATAAATSAANAAATRQEIVDKLANGEFKGEKGDTGATGPQGPQGLSGVMAPSVGMFSLYLDPTTGNLYADYPDGEAAPAFQYETATGNLYYLTGEDANG